MLQRARILVPAKKTHKATTQAFGQPKNLTYPKSYCLGHPELINISYFAGIQFLQHVERCRGLIYLLDGTDDPLQQYNTLKRELAQYNTNLSERPACVVVNKIDLPEGRKNFELMNKELKVLGISAKTGLNLNELLRAVRVMYDSGESRHCLKVD